jgi:hypothetical protein
MNRGVTHVARFPAIQAPETVTCGTFCPFSPNPLKTVTCDTSSFAPSKPQKPLHVTPFLVSLQTPDTVTSDTFSLLPPKPRNRYM